MILTGGEEKGLIDYRRFIGLILLVNFWSNAVFYVLDLLLFYISFEAVLIPKYYLIGNYGSRNKKEEGKVK